MDGREIEAFYEAHDSLNNFLIEKGEISFAAEVSNNFRRSLVLAVASYFEAVITSIVKEIPRRHASNNPFICGLVDQKVIPRQYHTYFSWDKRNANSFFRLFGDGFLSKATQDVKADSNLDKAIRDFLELGETRNKLVHINYVTFDIDKSPNDIIVLFRSALIFIEYINRSLLENDISDAIEYII